ncbi:SCO2322 family protein [Luteipulveratus halotolerans]|uniref:Gram-positive cocci surface proteins LPxTG domain-containing protein n=1 Tax=Luteipulveratus halotolerans TaxID=1631356 RepID=A0A0L6CHD0_9MICO|nr:SCO2322 family protein [Luteipulveratus halotolerans]KNX36928.1 hypothetical protein VV01_06805 [Luteipulveratus halotolerans]
MTVRPLTRAVPVLAAAAALAVLLGLLSAPTASAAAYRYWGYYQLKGTTWSFSPKGAAQTRPADGSVEGWRFAVAGETDTRTPRGVVTFEAACKDTPAKDGTKRVAVVLDYGRAADAESGTPPQPKAACAQVPTNATGADVLSAVATVRTEKAQVCGVDSWPASGCSGEVKNVSAAAKAADDKIAISTDAASSSDDSSNRTPLLIGGAVLVLLLAGAALTLVRRRRTESA